MTKTTANLGKARRTSFCHLGAAVQLNQEDQLILAAASLKNGLG